MQITAVAAGGAVGAVSRFLLNSWTVKAVPRFAPAGTLLVNVLGCLLIGLLVVALAAKNGDREFARAFLVTGLLGSLTTFSTFGFQTVELVHEGATRLAIINVIANIALGLPAVLLGMWIGKRLVGA